MLALVNFSFEFGGRYLFQDSSWHIKPGEKIGLVGFNGTGKSTLLRLITGEYELREGILSKTGNLKIGFLNQDLLSLESHSPLVQVVLEGREDLSEMDRKIEALLVEIETDHDEKKIQRLIELQEQFGIAGGYEWRSEAEKILEGLGFATSDLEQPLSKFSGGWRMRAMLAKLLLMQPDVLLLDEPTNHLDLVTIKWLENYLKEYPGTYIIVSHDRYFLDRCVNRIVEVAHQQLYHYKGNYSEFLEQKEERDEMQQRRYENQQDFIRQQRRFIERFRYKASKAAAVQSRVKALEKLDRLESVEQEARDLNIKFTVAVQPGKVICELKNIHKSYGTLDLLKNADGAIYRGDKIALIGANGKGKSTLLRIISGTEPFEGERQLGHNVTPSFYAQHQLEALHLEFNPLEELSQGAENYTEKDLRTVLGCFLFTGDDVFKKIKVLSGGEKSRVALAKTLITKANFLLLDEPTNHLDMFSTSILAEALYDYEGSFIMVSHDRAFIQEVANKIWWIENGKIREFVGTYEEYEEWVATRPPVVETMVVSKTGSAEKQHEKKKEEKPSAENKVNKNKLRQWEQEMEEIEAERNKVIQERVGVEEEMAKEAVAKDFAMAAQLTQKHQELEAKVKQLGAKYDHIMEQWLEAQR